MDRLRGEKSYHWIVFVVVVALAAGVATVVGYRFVTGNHRINENARALDRTETALTALCALRSDLDSRIVSERRSIKVAFRFLRQHPDGAFGFSAAQIKTSIQGQQRTLTNSRRTRKSLRSLACKGRK